MILGIRLLWLLAVSVIAYFYPPAGALFAIATASYWLLAPFSPVEPSKELQRERHFCVTGNHYIGNEPYSFLSSGDARCARCQQQLDQRVDQTVRE